MERSWDGATKCDQTGKNDLLSANKVEVELIPEKKGLVIKHVEYLVSSEKHQSQVSLFQDVCRLLYFSLFGFKTNTNK